MLTRLFASSLVAASVLVSFACASAEEPAGKTGVGGAGAVGGAAGDAGDGGGVGGSGGFPSGGGSAGSGASGGAGGSAGSGGVSGSAGDGGVGGGSGTDGGGGAAGTGGCTSVGSTPSGLLLYYACEDLAGPTVTDGSTNANNGTAIGGVTFQQTASLCLGIGFDGTGYIDVGTPPSLSNLSKVTVEAWVKRDQATGSYSSGIVAKSAGNGNLDFSLAIRNDGALYWASASADAQYGYRALLSSAGVIGPTWIHVAGTYDSTTNERRFYKNGVALVATAESFGGDQAAPMDGTGPVRIGNYQWDGGSNTDYLDGTVDDVRIWGTVRTPAEICADAGGTFSGSTCTP